MKQLFYLNYAMNFFFYVISGKQYRNALRERIAGIIAICKNYRWNRPAVEWHIYASTGSFMIQVCGNQKDVLQFIQMYTLTPPCTNMHDYKMLKSMYANSLIVRFITCTQYSFLKCHLYYQFTRLLMSRLKTPL